MKVLAAGGVLGRYFLGKSTAKTVLFRRCFLGVFLGAFLGDFKKSTVLVLFR
jgi:hypothetical protein